jgi:hypothetical protein
MEIPRRIQTRKKNTVAERRARYRGPYLSENLKFG